VPEAAALTTPADDEEDRIWTVEEVMAKSTIPSSIATGEDGEIDLDSLLDEIIRD